MTNGSNGAPAATSANEHDEPAVGDEERTQEDEERTQEDEELTQSAEERPAETATDVKGVLAMTQERVAEILTTTEAAAADIVDAANAEAVAIVRDTHARAESMAQSKVARLDSVTDALLSKASAVEDEIAGLRKLISSSIDTLGEELGVEDQPGEPPAGAATAAYTPPAATAYGPPANAPADEGHGRNGKGGLLHRMRASTKRDASEGVQLLATQMIAAGATWEEARVRLSEEFGVKDPTIALDAVYRNNDVTDSVPAT